MSEPSLPDALLAQVGELVSARLGLHFPAGRRQNLESGLRKAAADFGFAQVADCAEWLLSADLTPAQLQILTDPLTIGETYFFREKYSLDLLKDDILPHLISNRPLQTPALRLWSAGCSTGEEAYSLAILLDRYFPQLNDWRVTILATDINTHFLEKAKHAVYRKWSFRDTPKWVQQRYFSHTQKDRYVLHPHIKAKVSFAQLNLAEQSYPSFFNNTYRMDVIFCRNVLIYFNRQTINQIIDQFVQTLTPNGRLIVGPSEAAYIIHPQLHPLSAAKGTVFQKRAALPTPHPTPPPPAVITQLIPLPKPAKPVDRLAGEPAKADILDEATLLLEQGNYQQAATLLLNALSSGKAGTNGTPAETSMLTLLAQVYANQGNLQQALIWIEKAISVDKLNPCAYYLRGTILQEQNRPVEAQKAFKRTLFLDPDFVLAHFALGNLSRQNKRPGQANRHYKAAWQILEQRPTNEILPASGGLTVSELTRILQTLL